MWGGGAGLLEYRSALLASRGYVSFSLDYLRSEHLSADVEFKYFEVCAIYILMCFMGFWGFFVLSFWTNKILFLTFFLLALPVLHD